MSSVVHEWAMGELGMMLATVGGIHVSSPFVSAVPGFKSLGIYIGVYGADEYATSENTLKVMDTHEVVSEVSAESLVQIGRTNTADHTGSSKKEAALVEGRIEFAVAVPVALSVVE